MRHTTASRHSIARQPLEASCDTPCSIIAAGTGMSASSTPMRIMPPAIPRMPEMNEVARPETARMATRSGVLISLGAVDRALALQPVDVGGTVAQGFEDLARVLAEERCRALDLATGLGELDRQSQRLGSPGLRVIEFHHHLARGHLRVGEHVADLVHRAHGNADGLELADPVRGGPRLEALAEDARELREIAHAVAVGAEARVARELGGAERLR